MLHRRRAQIFDFFGETTNKKAKTSSMVTTVVRTEWHAFRALAKKLVVFCAARFAFGLLRRASC